MLAIPVLDLRGGASIQPGSPRDPVSAARSWSLAGFSRLHVTDLDAASGLSASDNALEAVVRDGALDIQADGGIESADQIDRLLELGASRVVVGARALAEPEWLASTAELFPGSLIVGEVACRRG